MAQSARAGMVIRGDSQAVSAVSAGVRGGFSRVELLIVVAAVRIVWAVSTRSVGDTIRRARVQKAAAIMATDIEQAFALAARQRTPMRLQFDSVKKTFSVVE